MKYKALFIHIPKTAGSSISTAPFILKYGSFGTPADTEFLRSMHRFTFVRNPYTRFASAALNLGYATPKTFEPFVKSLSLKDILETDYLIHIRPMWWYIQDSVDYIGRFESLKEHWDDMCKIVGETHDLPHNNKSKTSGTDYRQFYTPELQDIIYEIYKTDFDMFDYERR